MLRQIASLFSWSCIFPSETALEDNTVQRYRNLAVSTTHESKEHPLLNTLIVHEIFQYLECSDLIKCRGVCDTWNAEACRILKRSKKHRRIPSRNLKTFLQTFHKTNDDFPLRNYSLKALELEKVHEMFFHSLGSSRKITSLILSIPVNELPMFVQYAKPLICLQQLRLILTGERTIKDCPMFCLQSKNSILLGKRSLPGLTSISIRNGEPEKRIYCNYDHYITTLINSANSLANLEFLSWAVSTRLLREIFLEYIQTLRILGNALSEMKILILSKKKINNLKLVELFVDNNISDHVFEEFAQNMQLKNSMISISTSILNS